ncbi:MAG: hypothetical protein GWP05_01745 [Anaerolineaceae bacterium]|nr:hypothetical protein [Anaerolineaceae bacterium]
MTQGVDVREFEAFQRRAFKLALGLWMAALVTGLVAARGFSPIVGGVLFGGLASLAAFRFKVWTLRRLADEPTKKRASRLPFLDAARYPILAAGMAPAIWLAIREDMKYLFAAAAALLLCNLAVIIQAVRESRKA